MAALQAALALVCKKAAERMGIGLWRRLIGGGKHCPVRLLLDARNANYSLSRRSRRLQAAAKKTAGRRWLNYQLSGSEGCLQREQLPLWFAAVRQINNPVIAAYLQGLLLTGARREELAGLRWVDVDFQWGSLTIKDKVEGERTIPLTPFLAHLLAALPRRNEWVFITRPQRTDAFRSRALPTTRHLMPLACRMCRCMACAAHLAHCPNGWKCRRVS